jgi:hypothetical protein
VQHTRMKRIRRRSDLTIEAAGTIDV